MVTLYRILDIAFDIDIVLELPEKSYNIQCRRRRSVTFIWCDGIE